MLPIEVLYTPLDIPDCPKIDTDIMLNWFKDFYPQHDRKIDLPSSTAEEKLNGGYPWDLMFAYTMSTGWRNDFDKLFPSIVDYINCFGIEVSDLSGVVVLSLRPNVIGTGFWHMDSDWFGLRFYIECENKDENPLVIRQSILPYNQPPVPIWIEENDNRFSEEISIAKVKSSRQAYFLNNIRSCHTVNINKPETRRISVLLGPKVDRAKIIYDKVKDLVVSSAKKYKDYSILWQNT